MLRIVLVAAVSAAAVVAAAPSALAADLPAYEPAPAYAAPAPSTWTGGYVGAQAGYGWGKSKNGNNSVSTHPDGAVVGAYAGYDYQFDNSPVVVGIDTDINYNNAEAAKNYGGGTARVKNELNWSGATRAKIGYAFDNVMIYGAGGAAYGGQKVSRRIGLSSGSDTKTALGYTVGGGVESKLGENVTARIDYRYNDYGQDKYNLGGSKVKSELTENRVTAGVAYKFSAW